MSELADVDERAADRLTIFMLKELYRSAAHAMVKINPQAAELLFLDADKLITSAIARIHDQQSEGPQSSKIALTVGTRIAEVMDEAHGILQGASGRSATAGNEAQRAYEALLAASGRAAA